MPLKIICLYLARHRFTMGTYIPLVENCWNVPKMVVLNPLVWAITILISVYCPLFVHATAPDTITVASWNIQLFGPAKLNDAVRLGRIAEVIKEFDVIAIQEITHATGQGQPVVDGLTTLLQSTHHRTYTGILGPRTGCPGGRTEQYAILYDSDILQEVNSRTIADDPNQLNSMCRDPLVATLRFSDASASFTFTLIVVHADPDPITALTEDLHALGRIYGEVQAHDPQEDDVILLGYLNTNPQDFGGLNNIPDLVYAVPGVPTMVRTNSRLDNVLFQWGPTGEDFAGEGGVFPVASFLGITDDQAHRLSDHLPVYAVFFTRHDTR